MRYDRWGLRAPVAVAGTLATILTMAGVATADDHETPSQAQVDSARADVDAKAQGVAAIQAELDAARAQLAAANERASIAAEAYNGAIWKLSQAREKSAQARRTAAAAQQRVDDQRDGIASLVVQSYQNGTDLTPVAALMSSDGPIGVMNRSAVVGMAGNSMQADFDHYTVLNKNAATAKEQAADAEKASQELAADARAASNSAASAAHGAAAMESEINGRRQELISQLAQAQNISVGLAEQRQADLEQQQAEDASAAQAAEENEQPSQPTEPSQPAPPAPQPPAPSYPTPEPPPAPPTTTPPPSSGGVQAAIAFAKAQLGEPYRWGAEGPDSWDCSGLTMKAWAAGGISLPHYSVAQYDMGTPIPVSQAKPGDLLFWSSNGRPSGIHHVALSLGGTDFIEAPRTGLDVRYNTTSYWYPNFAIRL